MLFSSSLNLEFETSMKATASASMELEFTYDGSKPTGDRYRSSSKFDRKFEVERPEISGRALFDLELGPVFSFNVWLYELIEGS